MSFWFEVTTDDIVSRFRLLKPNEEGFIDEVIADAQDILEGKAEEAGITVLASSRQRAYVRTVASMVIRVLRNPDGYLTETIDDYTYRRDSAVSAGVLYASDDEIAGLRPAPSRRRRGAFSIELAP